MEAMQGGGCYNEHSAFQQVAVDKALASLEITDLKESSITLADYGCSEGGNSIKLLQGFLSKQPSATSATLVFNDSPSNDFSSLSATIHASISGLSQDNRLQVYPVMVPRSFYEQLLPDDFVHVGFCFNSLHWMQHAPQDDDAGADPAALAASAHRDLVQFLAARHREVRAGGNLVLAMPIQGGTMHIPQLSRCTAEALQDVSGTYHVLPSLIARLPIYLRSMDEVLSAISANEGQWRVVQNIQALVEHPSSTFYHSGGISKQEYASVARGATLAVFAPFLVREAKRKAAEVNGKQNFGKEEEAEFLEVVGAAYERKYLESYCHERFASMYAFLKLEKM